MTKFVVGHPGPLSEQKVAAVRRRVADQLGVPVSDVIVLGDGLTVRTVEVPETLVRARQKADEEEAEAARAESERLDRAAQAIADAEKAKAAPVDYDSWTVADLHAEATRRDIPGRGQMNKADLIKALSKG